MNKLNISTNLLEKVKRKCYITDTSEITTLRLEDIITNANTKLKRLIGVSDDFDFEAKGNEEELDLFLNYCWYDWNDASNEFKNNYLGDIISIRQKYEVVQYNDSEEA